MRNLTIKREKKFVGCAGKMKVYIEDEAGELDIGGVRCRKLGDLKNGEEKTFQIEDRAARLYVIAGEVSRNYCNDFYPLPAGTEDISLKGHNYYNLAAGNPFRFDGQPMPEVSANRRSGTKKGLVILMISVLLGVLAGFGVGKLIGHASRSASKTFTHDDMSITLNKSFSETDADGFEVVWANDKCAVFVFREKFSDYEGLSDYTVDDYCRGTVEVNELPSDTEIKHEDGLTYFEFERYNGEMKKDCKYFSSVYKTDKFFAVVQFATVVSDYDSTKSDIIKWAKSVEFKK